jgi:hypothetical protein
MKNLDERTRERMDEIKLLLGMSGFGELYDEKEIERIARLPIELSFAFVNSIIYLCKGI